MCVCVCVRERERTINPDVCVCARTYNPFKLSFVRKLSTSLQAAWLTATVVLAVSEHDFTIEITGNVLCLGLSDSHSRIITYLSLVVSLLISVHTSPHNATHTHTHLNKPSLFRSITPVLFLIWFQLLSSIPWVGSPGRYWFAYWTRWQSRISTVPKWSGTKSCLASGMLSILNESQFCDRVQFSFSN